MWLTRNLSTSGIRRNQRLRHNVNSILYSVVGRVLCKDDRLLVGSLIRLERFNNEYVTARSYLLCTSGATYGRRLRTRTPVHRPQNCCVQCCKSFYCQTEVPRWFGPATSNIRTLRGYLSNTNGDPLHKSRDMVRDMVHPLHRCVGS